MGAGDCRDGICGSVSKQMEASCPLVSSTERLEGHLQSQRNSTLEGKLMRRLDLKWQYIYLFIIYSFILCADSLGVQRSFKCLVEEQSFND